MAGNLSTTWQTFHFDGAPVAASDRTYVLTICGGRAGFLAKMLPGWVGAFGGRVVAACQSDPEGERVARECGAHVVSYRAQHFHAARARNWALAAGARLADRSGLERPLFLIVDCDTVLNDPSAVASWLDEVDRIGLGWLGRRPDGMHPPCLAGLVSSHFSTAREVGGYAERLTGYGFEDIAFRRRLIARVQAEPAWLRYDAVGHLSHSYKLRQSRYAKSPEGSQRINQRRWLGWERGGLERRVPRELSAHCAYNPPWFG